MSTSKIRPTKYHNVYLNFGKFSHLGMAVLTKVEMDVVPK